LFPNVLEVDIALGSKLQGQGKAQGEDE
jgi:hypothetical protein